MAYAQGSEPALFLGRGYTGHEHLPWFGVINANARLYDPMLGRFLSPDPYVQDPEYTQSYNRYSYCLNNPLIYTDPTGEKWWHWLLGISVILDPISTLTSLSVTASMISMTVNTTALAVFTPVSNPFPLLWVYGFVDEDKALNAGLIWDGLFMTDPNKNFWGKSWQLFSRFTWEAPQEMIGYSFAQYRNMFGAVDNVDYFNGATLVNKNKDNKNPAGMTLGNYILGTNLQASTDDWTFMHEYGHTLQSRSWGPLYTFVPALLSGADMLFNGDDPWEDNPYFYKHDIRWYETGANRRAARYFDKYYGIEWDDIRNPRSKDIARSLLLTK